jgi:tRNA (cmo5U34)-methyltransferase
MTDSTFQDKVFARPLSSVKAFEFDDEVARVFDDMISRSVPGYDLMLRLIALYADIFVAPRSRIYDLGCSTGLVSRVIALQTRERDCVIQAVDNSPSMIEQCRRKHPDLPGIGWTCGDIEDIEIRDASMVVLNLTLQFIAPGERVSLLRRIHDGLRPGGVLVLSEKLAFVGQDEQQTMTELYQAFKKHRGYSDLEISQKRAALEKVLIPDDEQTHQARLAECGFGPVYKTFQCLNFSSFLALKT